MSDIFRKTFILIFSCLITVSCADDLVTCNSYILGFYDYDEIGANSEYVDIEGIRYARVNIYIPQAHMVTDVFGDRASENGTFRILCKRFNDTEYEERHLNPKINKGNTHLACYPSIEISGISVKGETDWDVSHPRGTSLDDIVLFEGVSIYPYIKNHYVGFDYKNAALSDCFNHAFTQNKTFNRNEFYPIDKPLAELSHENMLLLGAGEMSEPGGVGYPEHDMLYYTPDVHKEIDRNSWECNMFTLFIPVEHTGDNSLTVTIKYNDGKELSTTVTVSDQI